jgi:hypothetical protein
MQRGLMMRGHGTEWMCCAAVLVVLSVPAFALPGYSSKTWSAAAGPAPGYLPADIQAPAQFSLPTKPNVDALDAIPRCGGHKAQSELVGCTTALEDYRFGLERYRVFVDGYRVALALKQRQIDRRYKRKEISDDDYDDDCDALLAEENMAVVNGSYEGEYKTHMAEYQRLSMSVDSRIEICARLAGTMISGASC